MNRTTLILAAVSMIFMATPTGALQYSIVDNTCENFTGALERLEPVAKTDPIKIRVKSNPNLVTMETKTIDCDAKPGQLPPVGVPTYGSQACSDLGDCTYANVPVQTSWCGAGLCDYYTNAWGGVHGILPVALAASATFILTPGGMQGCDNILPGSTGCVTPQIYSPRPATPPGTPSCWKAETTGLMDVRPVPTTVVFVPCQ